MAQPGGSATANGILLQVLGTLGRAVEFTFRSEQDVDATGKATLVIEPTGGGGDLQFIADGEVVAEQWKARSGAHTWSLAELIEDVLPDLYCATDLDADEYRFVTEGRMGTWGEAYRFFQSLGPRADGLPARAIDETHMREFARGESLTERELFDRVVKSIRSRRSTDPIDLEAVVRRFLSRFRIRQQVSMPDLIAQINGKLTAVVERVEDVEAKRNELCGIILSLSGVGGVRITPADLLRRAGLTPHSFLDWNGTWKSLAGRLQTQLSLERYVAAADVRQSRAIACAPNVLAFAGESGQGKTWALARFALAASAGSHLTVWVPAARMGRRADEIIAEEVWCAGLAKDAAPPLERIAARRATVNPHAPSPWLVACVDGVNSKEEAAYLATLDWMRMGVCLAVSAPTDVADHLRSRLADSATVHHLRDFLPAEVRDYLHRNGRSWVSTPHDIRGIIRRPILAKLYVDLAPAHGWDPKTEYELMEAFWHRIAAHQHGQTHDFAAIRSLALTLLHDGSVYPWTPEQLVDAGVDAASLGRLEQAGWIRPAGGGNAEMSHDRLLCWALAQGIVQQLRAGATDVDRVTAFLSAVDARNDAWAARFGYVRLDVLWLACDPALTRPLLGDLWRLIATAEDRQGYGLDDRALYERHLPTLGSRVIPVVLERVKQARGDEHSPHARLAALTIRAIAAHDTNGVRRQVELCLRDEAVDLQEVALRVLVNVPGSGHLDRLWALHAPTALMDRRGNNWAHTRYSLGFDALAACLQLEPEWIVAAVAASAGNPELLGELGYLAARLEHVRGQTVWEMIKGTLFDLIPPGRRRSLVYCVLRFRDRPELDTLARWVAATDELVGPLSLSVLAHFEPRAACRHLGSLDPRSLWFIAGELRDALNAFAPSELCAEIRRLAVDRAERAVDYLELVSGDTVDAETADLILDVVGAAIRSYLDDPSDANRNTLFDPLRLANRVRGAVMLERLRLRRGSGLERALADAAVRWADNETRSHDHQFEEAKTLLMRIGGEGYTRVVNAMLSARSQLSRLSGCTCAMIRGDAVTRELLAAASLQVGGLAPNDSVPAVQQAAMVALAAIDAEPEFVASVLAWGHLMSPDVASVRGERPPLTEESLRGALDALNDTTPERRVNALLAIGLSGRQEHRPALVRALLDAPLDSRVAKFAMLALEDLGGYAPEFQERLVTQYRSGHHKLPAARLMSTAALVDATRMFVQAVPADSPLDETDLDFIVAGSRDAQSRLLLEEHIRTASRRRTHSGFPFPDEAVELLNPATPDHQQQLFEAAERPGHFVTIVGRQARAIERLGATQPEVAFELAQQSLESGGPDRDDMPDILLALNAARAIPLLLEFAVREYDPAACRLIALAIRRVTHSEPSIEALLRRAMSGAEPSRRVAAHVAGYLGAAFLEADLRRLFLTDGDQHVCTAAIVSLRRQQREAGAEPLIRAFDSATGIDAHALASEIIWMVEPEVLTSPDDCLGFLSALRQKPFAMRKWASTALKARREKIKTASKRTGAKWKKEG